MSFPFNANAAVFVPGGAAGPPPPPLPGDLPPECAPPQPPGEPQEAPAWDADSSTVESPGRVTDEAPTAPAWEKTPLDEVTQSKGTDGSSEFPTQSPRDEATSEKKEKKQTPDAKAPPPDSRPHLNVVFIGHVDAGKSTTCGNILLLSQAVDPRTVEKYQRDAKEKGRDSWFLAFLMDLHEEERQKGKTQEVGRACFETDNRRFTILDAPGHNSFVPSMISGAAQADVAVLIVSARKGEFETGFEKGGQTREHTLLAKTLGVNSLIVAVNKMDDSTCDWSEERYREIEKKLMPFLRGCGYRDVTFIPISGFCGVNIKEPAIATEPKASWVPPDSPALLQILDGLEPPGRDKDAPLRIPLLEGFKDQGAVMASGKVESGNIVLGQQAVLMPGKMKIRVTGIFVNEAEVSHALPGENVALRVTGVESEQIGRGSVLCSPQSICHDVSKIKAQIVILDLLEHRPVLTAGYGCVLHAHTCMVEVEIERLIEVTEKGKKKKVGAPFARANSTILCSLTLVQPTCLEAYTTNAQLGRFTLRDEGRTIGIGKILSLED